MKRKFFCFVLAAMTMLVFCVSTAYAEAQLYYVTDDAGLLTADEDLQLEQLAEDVSHQYGVGVYVITLDDYRDYGFGDVYETTSDIYHTYTMGEGEGRDGIMLLLSMSDRDWAMFCYGEKCEYAFDSYGQEKLEEAFLDNFSENDWYGGFADYITQCSVYLQKAADGKPVRESPAFAIIIVVGMSLFVALLAVAFLWMLMSNVSKKATASDYIAGNLNLLGKTDVFAYRTETRRKIQRSSHSGGSRSHSGGGGSGRSGKF